MAKSRITQTLGGPSRGVPGLFEISDKIARLSEAGYAFETKRRKLEHEFEVTNSELREEYLAAVLEIHDFLEANMTEPHRDELAGQSRSERGPIRGLEHQRDDAAALALLARYP
jgi:hypothetical protein